MNKYNIYLDTSSTTSSVQELSTSSYECSTSGYHDVNVSYSSPSHEWLIDHRESYHMTKDKSMFSTFNDCNTNTIYVGDDRSLSVVGS